MQEPQKLDKQAANETQDQDPQHLKLLSKIDRTISIKDVEPAEALRSLSVRPDEVSFAPKDSIKAELTQSIAKQGSAGNNTSDEAFQGADTTDATPAKQA